MPLFEVDANRPLLVQSGRPPAVPGVGTSAHQVVESHIDGLLGEQIFPVAPGSGPDEPHLLALDATGSPVVVELVGELDRAALARALDHAGAAGRLTRGELAARYHGGPSAFQRDVATFYDSVPVTRSQPGRSGARLIVICQEAGEEILNAVDFLRQPSMPVEVLKLGVVHSSDGRRFVDVSPLVIHPASGPGLPRVSAADPAPQDDPSAPIERRFRRSVPRPDDPAQEDFTEKLAVGLALTGKLPAVVQAPAPAGEPPKEPSSEAARTSEPPKEAANDDAGEAPAERPRATRAERRAAAGASLPLPGVPAPVPADLEPELPQAPSRPSAPSRRSRTDRFAPPADGDAAGDGPRLGETFASIAAPVFRSPAPSPSSGPWEPSEPREARVESSWEPATGSTGWEPSWADTSADTPLRVPPLEAPTYTPPSRERSAYDQLDYDPLTYRRSAEPAPSYGSAYEPPTYATVPTDDEVDQDLVALAERLGRPTRLVWSRPRRRQHFEATLHTDGTIELAEGGRYRNPDLAASMAAGAPTADGWGVWRLGTGGPTLLEAYRQHFA